MAELTFPAAIATQTVLLFLSLGAISARFYVRILLLRARPTLSDTFVVLSWFACLGWIVTTSLALRYGFESLVAEDKSAVLAVAARKALFAANFPFDTGLFLVKGSLLAFYYENDLFPSCHRKEHLALHVVTAFTTLATFATVFSDIFTCPNVPDNWSIDPTACSTWFSLRSFRINYSLNVSSDVFVFGLPFILLRRVKLSRKVQYGLAGTFLLGGFTIAICTFRFVWGNLIDMFPPTVILLCTSEFTTAILVVCGPSLKPLLFKRGRAGRGESAMRDGEVNEERIDEALERFKGWSQSESEGSGVKEEKVTMDSNGSNMTYV